MSSWKSTPVDKDYVAWLDNKEMSRHNQNGKGDDMRPFNKRKFDKGFTSINWSRKGVSEAKD